MESYKIFSPNSQIEIYFCPEDQLKLFKGVILEDWQLKRLQKYDDLYQREFHQGVGGFLRSVLAYELKIDVDVVKVSQPDFQKPRLVDVSGDYSLSHTSGGVLIAFSKAYQVGIDLELANRQLDDSLSLAKRIFAPQEDLHWNSSDRFEILKLWVAKEALAKSLGQGILSVAKDYLVCGEEVKGPVKLNLRYLDLPGFVSALAWF